MAVKVKGMQQMIDDLDKMVKVMDNVSKEALEVAGEIVKDKEVEVAKKEHNEYSEQVGWKEIKRYPVKIGSKRRSKYVNIGIRAQLTSADKKRDEENKKAGAHRPTHWDKIKGLWFNNYGFFHNRTGAYIAGSDWIGQAYDKSVDEAYKVIEEKLAEGLGL